MLDLEKNVPTTLDEAINLLYKSLTLKEIEFIKTDAPASIHFSAGMWIRNNWGLWNNKSHLVKDIKTRFDVSHGDDCSGLIFAGVWAKVNGLDVDKELKKEANNSLTHWRKNGVDQHTGKPIKK